MQAIPVKSSVRNMIGLVFGLFFLMNVVLLILAIWSAFARDGKAMILPVDLSMGVRLIIFAAGAALSWFLGRWLFLQMIEGNLGIDESSNAAFVLLFYILLVFAGVAFIGAWTWLWQAILMMVLILLTLFVLRRVLGLLLAVGIMAVSLVLGIVLYLAFR